MSKKTFLLGAIASIIAINSVFADTIVTSQSYVDNHDALKQDKITAGITGNVVTYNGTQNGQAQFSERGIFDPDTNFDYDTNEVATGHEGDLVTAESIFPAVGIIYQDLTDLGEQIDGLGEQIEQATNLPETTVTYKTCYQEVNGDCILWNLSDKNVYGHECETSSDCPCSGGYYGCNNGRCDIDGGCMVF